MSKKKHQSQNVIQTTHDAILGQRVGSTEKAGNPVATQQADLAHAKVKQTSTHHAGTKHPDAGKTRTGSK